MDPRLVRYYDSVESRLGYALLLGGRRHFSYHECDTYWLFPLEPALRAMEAKLFDALHLPPGSSVLDAGCGVGHVALYGAAQRGLHVRAIDVVPHHLVKCRRNITRAGLLSGGSVSVEEMDYHSLETIDDESLDGVYTMESLAHATHPEMVFTEFFRVLRPGGRIAVFEYEHDPATSGTEFEVRLVHRITELSGTSTFRESTPGRLRWMIEQAGFVDVEVEDYSRNIWPLLRLFFVLAILPFYVLQWVGLDVYFVNTMTAVWAWRGRHRWRYLRISATKPGISIKFRDSCVNVQ